MTERVQGKAGAPNQQVLGLKCQQDPLSSSWLASAPSSDPGISDTQFQRLTHTPPNGILFYKDIQPLFIKLLSDGACTIFPGNFLQWLITANVTTHTSVLV